MWYIHEGMGWWMAFGGVCMVVFWGGIIALIVWEVKRLIERGGSTPQNDPLDIVKERYARGEISAREFNRLKKDLT